MFNFWKNQRVLVTGGLGFVGSHLCRQLGELGTKLFIPRPSDYDLREYEDVKEIMEWEPDIVFNLAANVGGIGYNQNHPYTLFYDNTLINVNVIQGAVKARVNKFIQLGTVCAYPKFTPVPFDERALWDGYPEETNAPYGLAKRNALVQLQAARLEYGFNGVYILPTNLYGPRDHFEPEKSHVIPALIRKFVEANLVNQDAIEVWGSGDASRDFLYIDDAIRGILLVAEKWNSPEPINLGSGSEIRIGVLVEMIKNLTGYSGKVVYNASKPDGQPRRCLRTWQTKALGWVVETSLKDGLKKTIDWYLENRL